MIVNGVMQPVYIPPQLIAPNVPSTEAIAMLLATRPDLNPSTAQPGQTAPGQTAPGQTVSSQEPSSPAPVAQVSGAHVDLYA